MNNVTSNFYETMINILYKYNSWARDKNENLPKRWFVLGIEAWLEDFEGRIKNDVEARQEILKIELKHQRQLYEETKKIVSLNN